MKGTRIFLDIDGTLTVPGSNTPPESALKAIRQARQAGHTVPPVGVSSSRTTA